MESDVPPSFPPAGIRVGPEGGAENEAVVRCGLAEWWKPP